LTRFFGIFEILESQILSIFYKTESLFSRRFLKKSFFYFFYKKLLSQILFFPHWHNLINFPFAIFQKFWHISSLSENLSVVIFWNFFNKLGTIKYHIFNVMSNHRIIDFYCVTNGITISFDILSKTNFVKKFHN